MQHDTKIFETVPKGIVGIMAHESCAELGKEVDSYLTAWRCQREDDLMSELAFRDYQRETYLVDAACPRFGSGEGKAIINESIRGYDIFIMADVTNHSLTYKLCGEVNHMSPDDIYQDIKRLIAATSGKANRITLIMPFLYEGRQHRRTTRESMDCALALQELANMGVENVITFDAHDPRVLNAIPLNGFESVRPAYQFVKGILSSEPDLTIDADHLMIVSPDEGGTDRAVFLANVLGVDMGMFYKRRDYSKIVDGRNPIVAHEFLGSSCCGKDIWIVDDMISSGDSMIEVATELKKRGAGRIFVISTFGLFTNGLERFDRAYESGLIYRVVTTDLTYQSPELLERPYYINCRMAKYIAYIIDTINHDASISELLDPYDRIKRFVEKYNNGTVHLDDD